jgi:hypothetical protein
MCVNCNETSNLQYSCLYVPLNYPLISLSINLKLTNMYLLYCVVYIQSLTLTTLLFVQNILVATVLFLLVEVRSVSVGVSSTLNRLSFEHF